MTRTLLFVTYFLFGGCIFSHDSHRTIKLSPKIFLSIGSGNNTILYELQNDSGGEVLIEHVDSVVSSQGYICGFGEQKYFIFKANEIDNITWSANFYQLLQSKGLNSIEFKLEPADNL